MTFTGIRVTLIFAILNGVGTMAHAQPPAPAASVPRVMRIDGAFVPANGLPPAAMEVVTLAIYGSAEGGAPLWEETQEVRVDAQGRYAIFLGGTTAEGLPVSLFPAGEARWLGLRFARPGEAEPTRLLLTSVPYALRASDADTLGGLPSSAFVRAEWSPGATTEAAGGTASISGDRAPGPHVSTGTPNYIGKFTNAVDLTSSVLHENAGKIGLGTTTPFDFLHTRFSDTTGAFTGLAVQNLGGGATSYSGMLFYDHTGALGQFQGFNNSTKEYRINNIATGGSINFMLGSASRFVVKNTGIGMGTTAPTLPLDVIGNVGSTVYDGMACCPSFIGRRVRGTITAPGVTLSGDLLSHFGGAGYRMNPFVGTGFTHSLAGMSIVAVGDFSSTTQGAAIEFNTTNASFSGGHGHTVMMLSGSQATVDGRLVVSSSPDTNPLDTPQDATVSSVLVDEDFPGAGPGFIGKRARYAGGNASNTVNGDPLVVLRGVGYSESGFASATGAEIAVVAAGDWFDSTQPAQIRFRTTPAFTGARVERMVITEAGDVGIGTLVPADKLQVFGDLRVGAFGSSGCLRRFDGGTLTGTCSSDARFKRDITPFPRSLESVAALIPVHHWWRSAEFPEQHFGDTQTYGLIAQDVERVLPELVSTNEQGYKALDYAKLPLLTIQAVKELKADYDGMHATISDLRKENEGMQSRIVALERLVLELSSENKRRQE